MQGGFSVAISGYGCACSLGFTRDQVTRSLRSGSAHVVPVDLFSVEGCQARTAAQFPASPAELAAAIHFPAGRWSRAAQSVLVVLAEALQNRANFQPDVVIVGTTSGGMDFGEAFYRRAMEGGNLESASRRVRSYLPQTPVLDALRVLGIRAPVRVVSNACASGTNALGLAWQLVRSGRANRVIAGGYDTLAQLVYAGFDCLKASTSELCRPFDAGRSGLVLGEGAAFFLIEREGDTKITGYGSATDTHHLTQPHPSGSGPAMAMRRALEAARCEPGAVDYINAHGTATLQNDACEAAAIQSVCPKAAVSSTKAMTGHTLGAAGAIEAAFCAISLAQDFLPPTLNFRNPDPGVTLDLVVNASRPAKSRRVLSNSFGFGGANASLLLESA
ncbi:MAG: beta-ketoacyl-[acyl-carrier-protein] synthase family protein [Terrimicrobiaceae bacterium]